MRRHRKRGSALIISLWSIILLSLLVGSLVFEMHMEARLASAQRKQFRAEYLARAGVEWAKFMLIKSQRPPSEEDEYEEEFRIQLRNLGRGLGLSGYRMEFDDLNHFVVDIEPEQGRRNVNTLEEEDWKEILEQAGVEEDLWDELIGAFMDWTDENDLARLNGAEQDDSFYTDKPYKVKNAPLDTIDELLLIKGFDRRIVYGGSGEDRDQPPVAGIAKWLTVWGDGKVNVNSAGFEVLRSMQEFDDFAVDSIIQGRNGLDELYGTEDDGYTSVDQAMAQAGLSADFGARLTANDRRFFRIISRGESAGETRVVYAIFQMAGNDIAPMFWKEEYMP